jgi:hypothetical protein
MKRVVRLLTVAVVVVMMIVAMAAPAFADKPIRVGPHPSCEGLTSADNASDQENVGLLQELRCAA